MRPPLPLAVLAFLLTACPEPQKPEETGEIPDECTFYADADGDGYGDATAPTTAACDEAPGGTTADATDCDDADASSHPGADEICDGRDNDCDNATDEDVLATWYQDADGDGVGDDATATTACEAPEGTVATGGDCDDTDATTYPGAPERCDDRDNDCDDAVDEDLTGTWYADADGDGWGDAANTLTSCDPGAGWVSDGTDCDDSEASVHPDATETCDGLDNDCDGTTDDGLLSTWYADRDADGWGDADTAAEACDPGTGWTEGAGDCDDNNSAIHPEAEEICDHLDNDCDGLLDADDPDLLGGVTWYADADGDGWGVDGTTLTACEAPTGYAPYGGDCDDTSAAFHPGAEETDCADPNDYNCDGSVGRVDTDADGFAACEECDDSDATVYPGATETCDDQDDDCDGTVDEADAVDAATWYADTDGDLHGDPSTAQVACDAPWGWVSDATDCDDTSSADHPGAPEWCDGRDNDCDGTTDEPDASDAPTWYADADADGWGDAGTVAVSCEPPTGYVSDATDCNDTDAAVNPATPEVCNGLDDDCDGITDEPDAADAPTWYADADADGWGDAAVPTTSCLAPSGYVSDATDCDDTDTGVNPGATETCDGQDDDCDGVIDEDDATGAATWYADLDGDGYGDPASPDVACTAPSGYVSDATDCDDTRSAVNPTAIEACNGLDDDCDGAADEPDALDAPTWYRDADGDGWGDDTLSTTACTAPSGWVASAGDCDDTNPAFRPDAPETDCADPTDWNCDGSVSWADADADGFAACEECDDGDAAVNPAATETCNGLDDDCDGTVDEPDAADAATWYADADADGWGDATSPTVACTAPSGFVADATDCDDTRSLTHPGGVETCNGEDDDCDGTIDEPDATDAATWYADADGDGYGDAATPTQACARPDGFVADATDCDDTRAATNPGATESCNGEDDDCDGTTDEDTAADAPTWYADADGDGYGEPDTPTRACTRPSGFVADATDCDDTRAATNPGATETCNGDDDDCDGTVDEDDAADAATWYADADGDGYGDPDSTDRACTLPDGFVSDSSDCDDTRAATNPGATEYCNGEDDDCDGTTDEDAAVDAPTWYADADADGFGDLATPAVACDAPVGFVADSSDCDDARAATNPDATERCNGEDDDCDGIVDEPDAADAPPWYADEDGDGYGDFATSEEACAAPSGYVADATDCDDAVATTHPGADEYCNSVDDDCDGDVDEDPAVDATTWYEDLDGDGFGDPAVPRTTCTAPTGYVDDDGDCDDSDADVNPDGDEAWYDEEDTDCDGAVDPSVCDELPEATDIEWDDACGASYSTTWSVATEWKSSSFTYSKGSSYTRIMMAPVVGRLYDDNGDGVIDDSDTPVVLYNTFTSSSYPSAGYLRAMWGDGSGEVFSVTSVTYGGTTYSIHASAGIAVGDLEGDGSPDIVTISTSPYVVALEADGTVKWVARSASVGSGYTYPSIADMDGDGDAEVLAGAYLFDHTGAKIASYSYSGSNLSFPADMDLDGVMEVVTGNAVYEIDGTKVWSTTATSGKSAVADFDGDLLPEVVNYASSSLSLIDDDGTVLWTKSITGGGTTAPCVADFDGDGALEIGVAGSSRLTQVSATGSVEWYISTSDSSSSSAGCTAFDFNGDGVSEMLYADQVTFYIMSGATGTALLTETNHASGTLYEHPLVADVDNDGNAEVVLPTNNYAYSGWDGLYVLGETKDQWASARGVFNQHAYSITNIEEDLSVPTDPDPSWWDSNTFRGQAPWADAPADGAPDLATRVLGVCADCSAGDVTVWAVVDNTGNVYVPAGLDVALYVDTGSSVTLLGTQEVPDEILPGVRTAPIEFTVPASVVPAGATFQVVADDSGTGTGIHTECDETDNSDEEPVVTCE